MEKVILIIPAFNEAANILKLCQGIKDYDYIVINDASEDDTEQILRDYNIPHVTHLYNLGIGGAMQTGYKYAATHGYDIAVQFDGDGQHDLACVEKLIAPIKNHEADLVIGSRFITKSGTFRSSFARRTGIKLISSVMRLTTGRRIYDTTSGFRAANAAIISEFAAAYPAEYPEPITTAACLHRGYRIKEVPVTMNARSAGRSSIHGWKNFYYMFNVTLSLFVISLRRNR